MSFGECNKPFRKKCVHFRKRISIPPTLQIEMNLKKKNNENSNFLVISERRRGPTFEIDTPQT